MRKLFLGVCIVGLIFTGCASNQMAFVYDSGIPEDQMSFLWVPNYVIVKSFDDKTVQWTAPAMSMGPVKVGVPSGQHTFVMDTVTSGNNVAGVPNARNLSFTQNFQMGTGYQLINRNGEIVLTDLQSGSSISANPPEVIDVDVNTLFAEIRNNQVRARQTYHNQILRVTGKIQSIDQFGLGIGDNPLQMLVAFLDATERSKLPNLDRGQEVTVRGRLDMSDMTLDRAVIE